MWTISEYTISEHVRQFVLTVPSDFIILGVMMKAGGRDQPGAQPCLYVKHPADQKDTEQVSFMQLEAGETSKASVQYVGSYQEVGYFKVKHLFQLL
jgi:hypothetical protein